MKAHPGTIKGAEYCFMERTKRARMAFLVYLATEVKGNLNTPFPFTSHKDFSYTGNFLLQEYSWQSTFFHDKTNETMIICSWFRNIVISQTDITMHEALFWGNSVGSLGCCLFGSFKRATSFKFSPVSFIITEFFPYLRYFNLPRYWRMQCLSLHLWYKCYLSE